MLQIEIFENRNRSLLLCGGFPVCQRYTRRQKSLLYSFPLSPSSSGQGRHPFKVDIAGSNPAGGTTAFAQVKAFFRLGLFSFRRMCAKPVRQMCAKPAENRPSDSPRGNGENPHQHGERPRHGPFSCPVRPLGYRFACPFANRLLARLLGLLLAPRLPLGRSASATPWLPLGVRLCPSARLPLAPSARTAATARRSPQAKGGPPHGTARPSALDIPFMR